MWSNSAGRKQRGTYFDYTWLPSPLTPDIFQNGEMSPESRDTADMIQGSSGGKKQEAEGWLLCGEVIPLACCPGPGERQETEVIWLLG